MTARKKRSPAEMKAIALQVRELAHAADDVRRARLDGENAERRAETARNNVAALIDEGQSIEEKLSLAVYLGDAYEAGREDPLPKGEPA